VFPRCVTRFSGQSRFETKKNQRKKEIYQRKQQTTKKTQKTTKEEIFFI
jgi:hypothetical protein